MTRSAASRKFQSCILAALLVIGQIAARIHMRKAGLIRSAIILTTIAVALSLVASAIGNRKVHAAGRFKLKLRPADHYNPFFFGNTLTGISNFLNNPKNSLILASASGVDAKHFRFEGAFLVRSTTLCHVHYSGAPSNTVQSVASNAVSMVALYLATNQPGLEVTYIDSGCFTPAPPWQRLEYIWLNFRYTYLK